MRSSKFLLLPAMTVLASLLAAPAFSANYRLQVSIPNLPPAVWPSCTTPWGSSLAHNGKVFAYSAESLPAGSSCDTVKQERTCNKGVLSGAFVNPVCEVAVACSAGTQAYATVGDFTFTMPEGCTTLTAKAWGAAGSGTHAETSRPNQYGYGGGGGFAQGTIATTGGTAITVVVGGSSTSGWGGGASAVLAGAVEVVVGGGGGAGRRYYSQGYSQWYNYPGGAGGASTPAELTTSHIGGNHPLTAPASPYGVAGGASSYGAGGVAVLANDANSNHYGGGGGGYLGGIKMKGGSSYALNGTTVAGAGAAPGNVADPDYVAPAGVGELYLGHPGRVVLTWQ